MPKPNHSDSPPQSFTLHLTPAPPPPSHPHTSTRFVLISDTHHTLPPASSIPDGDVLLHAGDLGRWGRVDALEECVRWLEGLPHRYKIVIAGNHDSALDLSLPRHTQPHSAKVLAYARSLLLGPSALKSGIHYLENSAFEFQVRPGGRRWTVWGSPGSPDYGSPAFQYSSHEAQALYAPIPSRTDILLTHTPPLCASSKLDITSSGTHAGCPVLAREVERIAPWMHVFGHIHEGRGVDVVRGEGEGRWRVSVNAAMAHSKKSRRYVHNGRRERERDGYGYEAEGAEAKRERGPIVLDWREDLMDDGWGGGEEEGVDEAQRSREDEDEEAGMTRRMKL